MTIQQRSVCIKASIHWQILVYTHLRSLPLFCVVPLQVNPSVHFYNIEQNCFLVDTFPILSLNLKTVLHVKLPVYT